MLKKTPYDLAGIQIRPAIQNLNTGEYLLWGSVRDQATAGMIDQRPARVGFWASLFRKK